MLREGNLSREARLALGDAEEVTQRTLRTWKGLDPEEVVAPPGRPRLTEAQLEEAREAVEAELDRQGWEAGEGPAFRGLKERFPRARVRRVMKELKSDRKRRQREHREAARVSVQVNARDALWAIDATHLGRDLTGREVQAEVVRELASTRTIDLSVGPPATAEDVIALLDRCIATRGTPPLVLLDDNGPPYVSKLLAQWCREHKVAHLFNLPHTPQHNGACEHGMRDLKSGAGLGKGTLVHDIEAAREALVLSRDRVDGNRLRATRGWMTAVEADQRSPPWWTLVDRNELYREITCAIENALLNSTGKRAMRVATRAAILDTLERFSVITRTRGGRSWTAQKAEDDL